MDVPLADFDIFSEEEKQILLIVNQLNTEYPFHQSISELFEAQVSHTPSHIAVVCEGRQITYKELNERANQATDLAKFIIAIQEAIIGKSDVFLRNSSVNEMMKPYRDLYTGLGFALGGQDEYHRFGQQGINEGYCSRFVGYSKLGYGAVVMVNTDHSLPIIQNILSAIAEEYHWPNYYPGQKITIEVSPSDFTDFVGEYELHSDYKLVIDSDGTKLLISGQDQSKFELFPLSELSYFARSVEIEIEFIKVEDRIIGVLCSQDRVQQFGKKLR
ncbi:hypothetical protein RQP50_16190 [Paenibacillus sp. chi10]|uniref:Penicillin-binding protein n=1 Tax=Paenibacillus suaedae TaxID=3077233 RepID=A0AAJ2JVK9_9BACL|nr:hypothetical protein [Paenibacillus sp. chi10]MDT8977778.1 hypothetical protein [Paenibacillus sp. chi10]